MAKSFFPKLAAQSILLNRRFYFPYLLTIIGTVAAFYNICAISSDPGMAQMPKAAYVMAFAFIGVYITALFSLLFLFYTNSFLMKRRTKELGLYNILGMGKRHIAVLLVWEGIYTALIGIGGGLCAGILLYKLVTLALYRVLRLEVPFGFTIQPQAVAVTALLFGAILLLTLLHNLRRITFANPIALLHGESAGEREPKTRWLLSILGVLTLGGGYAIAVMSRNSMEALALYFLAVFLVIIGTYCLFTALSIAVLKLLRKNRRFYYKTTHFIGISGMLFRMKRNAVGLANICILSTMVLVMLSGTLSLYLGVEDVIARQAPSDLLLKVTYNPDEEAGPDIPAFREKIRQRVEALGQSVTHLEGNYTCEFSASGRDGVYALDYEGAARYSSLTIFTFLTAQDYAALTGQAVPELAADEVLLYGIGDDQLTFTCLGETQPLAFHVKETLTDFPAISGGTYGNVGRPAMVVVRDMDTLLAVRELHSVMGMFLSLQYEFRVDLTGTAAEQYRLGQEFLSMDSFDTFTGAGEWGMLHCDSYENIYAENYGLAGGFLFLGVFLGLLFIMATVLIIYYKQISEGYEDRQRFQIMEKVGLDQRDIRRSVNGQVLTVFFLPLLVAALHVAFDFRLMLLLLEIFSVTNTLLTALCSLGVLLVFVLLYGVVFLLTAKIYYRIVSRPADGF